MELSKIVSDWSDWFHIGYRLLNQFFNKEIFSETKKILRI